MGMLKNSLNMIFCVALALTACRSDSKGQSDAGNILVNGRDTTMTFEKSDFGKLPESWSAETGEWSAANDGSDTALKMVRNTGSDFNIAVLKEVYFKDIEIETRAKAIMGDEDQGGGLVWRYKDSKNYYLIRANPLEGNIRLYRVVNGRRTQLESKNVEMHSNEWYNVKVIARGSEIKCLYNGENVFSASDDTFPQAGLIGFWSKADAVTLFDDLKLKVLK
jgi:hypothetical protein